MDKVETDSYVSPTPPSKSCLAPPGTVYDWIGGVPVRSDNSHFEWSGGVPFIILEVYVPGEGSITSFTATVISDQEVYLEWETNLSTIEVIVRAKYGSMPDSMSDGYLVYDGAGTNYSDTSMNFEEYLGTLVYRIWARGETGNWAIAEINIAESEGIMLALLLLLVVVTYFAYKVFNSYFCKIMAGMIWITVGILRIIQDQSAWDNLTIGTVLTVIGIYIMIMVAMDLVRGEE